LKDFWEEVKGMGLLGKETKGNKKGIGLVKGAERLSLLTLSVMMNSSVSLRSRE